MSATGPEAFDRGTSPAEDGAEAPLEEHAERREVAGARALQRRDLDPHDINFLSNSSRIQLCTEKYKS